MRYFVQAFEESLHLYALLCCHNELPRVKSLVKLHDFAQRLLSGYFAVNTPLLATIGLADLGSIADLYCQMVEMVKHKHDEANSLINRRQISVFFSFGVCRGTAEIYHEAVNFTFL